MHLGGVVIFLRLKIRQCFRYILDMLDYRAVTSVEPLQFQHISIPTASNHGSMKENSDSDDKATF